jgi:hypothetical protein
MSAGAGQGQALALYAAPALPGGRPRPSAGGIGGGGFLPPDPLGEDERARLPYERAAVLAEIGTYPPDLRIPGIARRASGGYTGYFNADASPAQGVHLEFSGGPEAGALQGLFQFGSILADSLRPLFGFTHPVWLGRGQEYNVAGRLDVKEFKKYGPRSLCARTWIGPWLVGLIGRDRLERVGGVTDTDWGGVQIDLLPTVWSHDIEPLADARTRAMSTLAEAGVFGDYAVARQYKPGLRWQDVPNPET